jgi:hypothetical protein
MHALGFVPDFRQRMQMRRTSSGLDSRVRRTRGGEMT